MNGKARGWLAFGLGATGVLWSLALILAAFVVPTYEGQGCQATPGGTASCGSLPSQTLFAVNGWWVVELLVGVALVAALAFWALHVRCASGRSWAKTLALVCVSALGAFSVLTGFSIGLFVLPVVLLLGLSLRLTPPPRPGTSQAG